MSTRIEPHLGPAAPAPIYQPAPMQEIISTERRPRGFGGRIVALLFWGFEGFMGFWLISVFMNYANLPDSGVNNIALLGVLTIMLWIWLFGTIILGIMMAFSRGEKITVIRRV